MKSLAFLTCWFGYYPWYFPYFIHSCSYNPEVDFIIITNNKELIPKKPPNVKIVHKTLEETKMIASRRLGFSVSIDYPYKMCEFKPAYGFLFPEIIKDYEFWGSGDIDIIFGNIRDFLTAEILDMYDFISLRHDYTTGCFALYRNTEQMNTFFMRSKDFRQVFSDPGYHNFDECGFAFAGLHAGKSIFEIDSKIESLTHIMKQANNNNEIKAHFDFILMEGATGRVTFDNGKIFYKRELEAILYHLVTFKKHCVIPRKIENVPPYYAITPTRILHHRNAQNIYS
jgi:hypothetical protein